MARVPNVAAKPEPDPEAPAKTPKARAKQLSELALQTLEAILRGGGSDAAKIAAAREVLDRAHGKSKSEDKPAVSKAVTVVIRRFSDGDGG